MQFSTSGGKSLVKLAKNSYATSNIRVTLTTITVSSNGLLPLSTFYGLLCNAIWPVRIIKFNAKSHEIKV
jgi:hypothetical protein